MLEREETQVAIVGAGPAGLVLSHLLSLRGIDSVVLELRTRDHVESRVRAGVLEHGTAELLERVGVGERMRREGLVHRGLHLQLDDVRRRVDLEALTGRTITVYGQQEVVKDLVAARLAAGGDVRFEATEVSLDDLDGERPTVRFRHEGREGELACAFVAGCDGSHGTSRHHLQAARTATFERTMPFAWLGILASVAPSSDELVYASSPRGFALLSMRSPSVSRLYLQVEPAEDLARWPDVRIWEELALRLASPGWELAQGPVLEKGVTELRSVVVEPMRRGRLFLAGDAAHIVPATGAKGLNLAVADVVVLATALDRFFRRGDEQGLDEYSVRCLERVWAVQRFSSTMTDLLHLDPRATPFERRLQRSRLQHVLTSQVAAADLAEQYVGLPLPRW